MAFEVTGVLPLANVLAQRYVEPILHDGVLRNDPLAAMLKRRCLRPYRGGLGVQQNATFDLMEVLDTPGSSITYDTSKNTHELESGFQIGIRHKIVPLSVDLEQLSNDFWGPYVNLDYLETRLQIAALSLSARIVTDTYKDGQQAGRGLAMNGLDEALSDGSTNGYQGVTFANYLTVPRSDPKGAPTKSLAPINVGSLKLSDLSNAVDSCWYGDEQIDYILTTVGAQGGFGIIRRAIFNPLIRLEQETDPDFGFTSMRFNGVPVFASQYAPGRRVADAADTKIGYTGGLSGETIWLLNVKHLNFWVHENPSKAFALWPFQHIPGTTGQAVAMYKASVNLTMTPGANRFSRYLFNVTD